MAGVFTVARAAYVERQLLARRTVRAVRHTWRLTDPAEIRLSWRWQVGPRITQIVVDAQAEAAANSDATVTALLLAQGVSAEAAGTLNPAAFSGTASDGRSLESLLELSNQQTLRRISAGQTPKQALSAGEQWLGMVVGTQIADANRVSRQVATVTRQHVGGYYRVLTPPSCSRCVVLAGKWFQWHADFERHPRCDCDQIAADHGSLDDNPELWTPEAYFNSLTEADKARTFGVEGARAIQDGADIGQVVNARDGMYSAGGRTYTRAGKAFQHGGVRLMPEQIYREAHGSRTEAIRLLERFGFIR